MKRFSRPDPVNNRNTIIMGNFARNRLGSFAGIFEDLPFPEQVAGKKFSSPEEYLMWEHGWHSLDTYKIAYRRLRDLFGPNTYRECGATVMKHQSMGLLSDTKYVLGGVVGGLSKVPQFNSNFNDIKDFILPVPAYYDKETKKVRCTFIIRFHDDIDPHSDYISDPHIQGILESSPELFGLPQAEVSLSIVPYDLRKLCEVEPEFSGLDLAPKVQGEYLSVREPGTGDRVDLGRRVELVEADLIVEDPNLCGNPVFLGESRKCNSNSALSKECFILERPLVARGVSLFSIGTILGGPYFVLNVVCEKEGSTFKSFVSGVKFKLEKDKATKASLLDAISQITKESKEKEAAHAKLREYSIRLEEMVVERTQKLEETQAKLIETEKRTLEHRITGGFAHEMRNALSGAQLEFKTTLNYKNQDKSATVVLKDSATTLLKNISRMHEEYGIPREKIGALFLPQLKTIAEIADHLSEVHAGVCSDLDRGLSITSQIREYARMSEFKKGEAPIDVFSLLKEYENRYKQDFERIGISYSVKGLEAAVVKADETHMNSIFSNLILNAKDALEEQGAEGKAISVSLERVDEAGVSHLKIAVRDNGPGIPEAQLNEIFEPFFSTKPTTGTGLGLGIVKKLVNLYDGKIQVASEVDKGTSFKIILPVDLI